MKYDILGRAIIEEPEIPQELLVHYIVKDYRRMYYENNKMKSQIERLRNSLSHVNHLQYAYSRIMFEQNKIIGSLIKKIEDNKLFVPAQIRDYYKKIKETFRM